MQVTNGLSYSKQFTLIWLYLTSSLIAYRFCDKPPIELLCLLVVIVLYMTSVHYKRENLLPSNEFIEDCEFVPELPYEFHYVEQVVESTDKLFNDICGQLKLNPTSERQLVQKRKLNIRSVTKDLN